MTLPAHPAALAVGTPLVLLGAPAPCFFGSTQRTIVLDGLIPSPQTPGPAGGLKALRGVLGTPPRSHLPLCSGGSVPGHIVPSSAQAPGLAIGTVKEVYPPRKKLFGTFLIVQILLKPVPALQPYPLPRAHIPSFPNSSFPWGSQCGCGFSRPGFKTVGHRNRFVVSPLPPPHPVGVSRDGGSREVTALVQGGGQGLGGTERHVTSIDTRPKYKLSSGKEERSAGEKRRETAGGMGVEGLTPPHR